MIGSIVFVVFLILKLTHVLDWSWWWITAPLWIGIVIEVIARAGGFVVIGSFLGIRWIWNKVKRASKHKVGGILMITAGVIGLIVALDTILPTPTAEYRPTIVTYILFLFPAVLPVISGVFALRRRMWGLALAGAILSIFWMPYLGVPSVIVIALAKREFEHAKATYITSQLPTKGNEIIDDEQLVIITCGGCFHEIPVRKGQGVIKIQCPNCGRESRIIT